MYNLHSSVDDSVLHLTPFLTSGRLTPLTRYRMMGRAKEEIPGAVNDVTSGLDGEGRGRTEFSRGTQEWPSV